MGAPFYMADNRPPIRPEHDVCRLAKFETQEMTWRYWQRDVALTLHQNGVRLPHCRPDAPCDSGACRLCMREFRSWFVAQGISVFEHRGPMTAFSLVHADWQRALGELHTLNLDKLKRQARRHIERAGLGVAAVGGIDFSYNEHSGKAWEPHWQGHLYVIFQGVPAAEIKKALAPTYPTIASILKPIHRRTVKTPVGAFSYAMKAVFDRRVSYVAVDGRGNAVDRPLKAAQQRELLVFLDHHKPADRMFLRNVRRRGAELVIMTERKRE